MLRAMLLAARMGTEIMGPYAPLRQPPEEALREGSGSEASRSSGSDDGGGGAGRGGRHSGSGSEGVGGGGARPALSAAQQLEQLLPWNRKSKYEKVGGGRKMGCAQVGGGCQGRG